MSFLPAPFIRDPLGLPPTHHLDAALLGKKKLPHFLQTLAERENAVVAFLQLIRPGIQHDVVPIEVHPKQLCIPTKTQELIYLCLLVGYIRPNSDRPSNRSPRRLRRNPVGRRSRFVSSLNLAFPLYAFTDLRSMHLENPLAVNVERDRKGLSQLDVFVIDLVAADAGPEGTVEGKMGSTAIREWLEARGTARV